MSLLWLYFFWAQQYYKVSLEFLIIGFVFRDLRQLSKVSEWQVILMNIYILSKPFNYLELYLRNICWYRYSHLDRCIIWFNSSNLKWTLTWYSRISRRYHDCQPTYRRLVLCTMFQYEKMFLENDKCRKCESICDVKLRMKR